MEYGNKTKEELISELENLKVLLEKQDHERNLIEFDLNERLKELNCHNRISEIMSNSTISLDEVCTQIAELIPVSWQFPEFAHAAVTVRNKSYSTPDFAKTIHSQIQKITANQKIIGQIEVCYSFDELPETDNIFLPEESDLLFSIAVKLGNYIEKEEKKEALQASEAKYKDLIDNINDVIYTTDNQANITFISPSIEKLLGYLPEEIIGKNFITFVGDNQEQLQNRFKELQQNLELQHDYKILTKNGDPRWFRFSSKAVIKEDRFVGATGTLIDITDKKLMEIELQNSEALYHSIIAASPDSITFTDLEGKILFSSPKSLELLGYSSIEAFSNKNILDFILPEDREKAQTFISQMFQGIRSGASDYRAMHADGTTFDIEVNADFIINSEGQPTSMVFITRDISNRKTIERKLAKSEEQYRKLVESVNDVIYEIDSNGTIKYASPSTLQVLGYPAEEVTGRNIFSFIYPEDVPVIMDKLKNLTSRNYNFMEYRYVRKDGSVRWVRSSTTPTIYNGEMIGATGTLTDITERKSAEVKLLKSEELFRSMVENLNDVVYEVNNDGIVKYVSPSIERFLGYSPEKLIGENFFKYMHPDDRPIIVDRLTNLGNKDYSFLEYRYFSKDGSICWVRSSTNPIIENDKVIGGRGVLIDITERKKAEEALRDSEERQRNLINSQTSYVLWTNLEGKHIYWNRKFEEEFGWIYQNDGVEGADALSSICDYHHERTRETVEKCIKNPGEIVKVELDKPAENGTVRITLWEFICLADANQIPQAIQCTGIDITDKKQAEILLQQSEANYKVLFFDSPDGYLILRDGKFIECNRASELMAGGDRSMILACSPADLSPEYQPNGRKSVEYAKELIQETFEKGKNSFEWLHKRFDGTEFLAHINLSVIEYEGNQVLFTTWQDITELRKSEEQLRKLSRAVEQSPVSIVITNLEGNIEYANPKACETTGYSLEELINQNPRVLKSGETKETEYNQLWNSITTGKEWKGIFHNKKKTGELYWESSTITPIVDSMGNITHFLAVKEDITDRKAIQEALEKSEDRFRQMAEQSQTVIWEVDDKGLFTYVSPVSKSVWGYDPNELIDKKHFYDLHPDEDREEFKRNALQAFEQRLSFHDFVNPIKTGDKRIIWITTNGVPLVDEQNNLIGYRGADNDITERKLAQEALLQSESALNYAQEIAGMGSWSLDLVRNKLIWSENYYRLLGFKPYQKGISNDHFTRMIHPDDSHKLDEKLQEIHSTKKTVSVDLRLILDDGQIKWVQNNIVPVFENDQLITLNGINIDITEKKLAEEKYRQQNERLSAIINAIPDLIFVTDRQGTYLEYYNVNDSEILYPKDQLIVSNVRDVFDEQTANLHVQKTNECINLQKLITYEYSVLRDGVASFYEARLAPLGNDRALRFIRDFTDKKTKDNELIKLSLAVEQSPVSIVVTDLNANIEYVNPAFEATSGYTLDEVAGKNTSILKSGQTPKHVYDDLWATIEKGQGWQNEWINKKKNGELYWENILISPIHDHSGKISNYLAIKQDITQRIQAEKEIRELNANLELKIEQRTAQLAATNANLLTEIEERRLTEEALKIKTLELENFFNVALDLLCIADTSGNFIKVNKAWEDILGYSVEELRSRQFLEFVHPEDIPMTINAMSKLSDQNPIFNFTNRYKTKDGGYRFIEWHSVPVGNTIYAAARDITERKLAADFENELLQLSPKLTGITLDEIDSALNLALIRIGKFLSADRAYIFEFNEDKTSMNNTYEWCNEGITPEKENLQDIPCDILPMWINALKKKENIVIPSVKNLPESWLAEREILEPQGIQSLIAIPIVTENNLVGFVGLDSVIVPKEYSTAEINMLTVWSSMLSSLINNQRTERLLTQSRQNYETFFNTIDDFLFIFDEQGNIVDTNNSVRDRLGYTTAELFHQSVLMVRPPERREEALCVMHEILEGKAQYCSIPLITKSGEQIPVETRIKRGYWNGSPVIFGVSKDISQIRLSEQKFASAFHLNSAVMTITRFDNDQFVDVNNAFVNTLGYSWEDIKGKTLVTLGIVRENSEEGTIQDAINRGIAVREIEINAYSKSNQLFILLLSAEEIYVGSERCILSVAVNITERKIMENEFRKAREEADQANLAKSEFLSRMSHELRTPMNSILGFAQLLEMGELNQGQKKGVTHIMKSGKHLLDLINEVLDISRIEAGRLSLSLEPVQVNAVIREMTDITMPLANERRLSILMEQTADDNLFLKADRQRLKQVLLNLLNNAIKYNKEGGSVIIKAQLMPIYKNGIAPVRISITDTGYGISEEDIPKLFNPFERIGAEKSTTEGTGLGLAVVKKLIAAMGGNLGVESILGEGSTFWIELPHSNGQLESAKKSGALSELDAELTGKSGTILYIEDNASNVELVEQILTLQRSEIRLITNMYGNMAVGLAIKHQPDLILLDLNLPDIHGSEVLSQLQAEEKTSKIPVVIISADAMPQQLTKLLKAGARNYLTKPLDVIDFLKIIDKFIVG